MKRLTKWLWAPIAAAALLAGCGNQADAKDDKNAVQEILIGTGNQMLNICFIDENGNLTGYDIELLKAIDEKLEDVSFKFETMDFSNLLLSLETNKIDMIAHNMAKNPEREEKFLFNQQPYNAVPLHVVVHEGNTEIQSIDDLNGKKVGLSPTSNAALFFEKYKEEHNFDTELTFITSGPDMLNQLKTGRIDAIFSFPFSVAINNKEAYAQQKIVGDELLFTDIFFMFEKTNEELANKVDGAIKELIENGTVSELLVEWFGEDYSKELID
ncbi:transporter substrate-binding domain-containing protein [Metasolibacillus meyeri]|uniref:Transporter substrate-binding domain-containing protein n=1 Tax=Metasolibacillus meyeri TaxID=1071052 RepID=A0AAW9NUQ7_9BACL|nr:transporter substrate-binding domain-containing protein [Metasolibacillus meyeri]MEC1179609.1 transporter substrate-binding domain-containing protein [Metasolibacillus meyeri]